MDDTAFYAADVNRLCTSYRRHDGEFEVTDPPQGQWSRPPAFPDGGAGLVSSVDDVLAFGRMLLRGGGSVLKNTAAEQMTRDQLTEAQRANVWPGFNLLDDRGWGYGVSVLNDGSYGWDGGFGTTWLNVPAQDLTIAVLTQRAADETGMPAVCAEVIAAARKFGS
jgi:CubicO group peptidase (beta-lactamase class C family)